MVRPIGYICPQPRRDSGAARLWQWARERRGAWTAADAAKANKISSRRCRAIVRALYEADILDCITAAEVSNDGQHPAEWRLSAYGRTLTRAPILIVDRARGLITGVRSQ